MGWRTGRRPRLAGPPAPARRATSARWRNSAAVSVARNEEVVALARQVHVALTRRVQPNPTQLAGYRCRRRPLRLGLPDQDARGVDILSRCRLLIHDQNRESAFGRPLRASKSGESGADHDHVTPVGHRTRSRRHRCRGLLPAPRRRRPLAADGSRERSASLAMLVVAGFIDADFASELEERFRRKRAIDAGAVRRRQAPALRHPPSGTLPLQDTTDRPHPNPHALTISSTSGRISSRLLVRARMTPSSFART